MRLLVKIPDVSDQTNLDILDQRMRYSNLWKGISSKQDRQFMCSYIEIEFVDIDQSNLKEFTSILGLIVQVGTII